MTIKEVHDRLKKAYRQQNKAYNEWEKKVVGPVPEFLHTPELLNSELIHSIVESVDWLLKEREKEEKAKVEPFKARVSSEGVAATSITDATGEAEKTLEEVSE